jgi:enoyl-[acyl-carrier protein] reductase I
MPSTKLTWKTNVDLAAGKGATVQEFVATAGVHELKIDVAPWGEGHLKIDGRKSRESIMPKTGGRPFVNSRKSLMVI